MLLTILLVLSCTPKKSSSQSLPDPSPSIITQDLSVSPKPSDTSSATILERDLVAPQPSPTNTNYSLIPKEALNLIIYPFDIRFSPTDSYMIEKTPFLEKLESCTQQNLEKSVFKIDGDYAKVISTPGYVEDCMKPLATSGTFASRYHIQFQCSDSLNVLNNLSLTDPLFTRLFCSHGKSLDISYDLEVTAIEKGVSYRRFKKLSPCSAQKNGDYWVFSEGCVFTQRVFQGDNTVHFSSIKPKGLGGYETLQGMHWFTGYAEAIEDNVSFKIRGVQQNTPLSIVDGPAELPTSIPQKTTAPLLSPG